MPAEIINLLERLDKSSTRSDTDRLFDTSDVAMAERLGRRAQALMQRPTADVKHTARLAFSFAARAIATLEQLQTSGVTH